MSLYNRINSRNSWPLDFFLLFILITFFYFTFLGSRPLLPPDEARYAEIAREMLVTDDYITPHLNFIKYFEKPPLFYWLQAAAIKIFGLTDWSTRLINVLASFLTVLLTYSTARLLYGRRSGWYSSLVLSSSLIVFAMAHVVTLDATLTLFLTAGLFSFLLGINEQNPKKRTYYMWGLYFFSGLAMMTKGLIGAAFPALIIGAWVICLNKWKEIKYYSLPSGVLIFLLVVAPWHIAVQLKNPEFFNFYFIDQHFARYFTDYAHRGQSFWFLPAVLLLGFFPWTVFLFQALKAHWPKSWKTRATYQTPIFLMLTAFLIFMVFQGSHSILVPYILPIFPPLAILTGHYLADTTKKPDALRSLFRALRILGILGVCIGAALIVIVTQLDFDELSPLNKIYFLPGIVMILGSLGVLFKTKQSQWIQSFATVYVGFGLCFMTLNFCTPTFNQKSLKPLAELINEQSSPQDLVVAFHYYPHDLSVYTQRRIVLVNNLKDELRFGMQYQNMTDWNLKDSDFWEKWHSSETIFAIMRQDDYQNYSKSEPLPMIAQTKDFVLISNHKGKL